MIFDSRDESFKTPFGAVASGTAIRFSLSREGAGDAASLCVIRDGQQESEKISVPLACDGEKLSAGFTFPEKGLYFYWFELADGRRVLRGTNGSAVLSPEAGTQFQQTVYDAGYRQPQGFAGKVMYQIFPDRFAIGRDGVLDSGYIDRKLHDDVSDMPLFRPDADGVVRNNDFFGGNFEGIREKLPYLEELGVGIIYLNPIFESHSNHRYDTADYMKTDPLLGTEEDFARLCGDAKKRGIKIILDGVFSHTGADSVYFDKFGRYEQTGAYESSESPYRSWYKLSNDGREYQSWWGFENLPEVDEENPSFAQFICGEGGVIEHWLRAGASGFRLDVADELPDGFIALIRECVKRCGEDKLLIGEVWEDASNKISYGTRRKYLLGDELDSVMNYPFKDAIIDFIRRPDAALFTGRVASITENYPKPMLDLMMNSLGTHDTPRAMTALTLEGDGDREWQSRQRLGHDEYLRAVELYKLAAVLQFTLPGIPCIYYGDEIGMQGCRDPFNRAFFDWERGDANILRFIRELSSTRRSIPAFADGAFVPVPVDTAAVAFERRSAKGAVGVAVNRNDYPVTVKFSKGKEFTVPPWRHAIVRL